MKKLLVLKEVFEFDELGEAVKDTLRQARYDDIGRLINRRSREEFFSKILPKFNGILTSEEFGWEVEAISAVSWEYGYPGIQIEIELYNGECYSMSARLLDFPPHVHFEITYRSEGEIYDPDDEELKKAIHDFFSEAKDWMTSKLQLDLDEIEAFLRKNRYFENGDLFVEKESSGPIAQTEMLS